MLRKINQINLNKSLGFVFISAINCLLEAMAFSTASGNLLGFSTAVMKLYKLLLIDNIIGDLVWLKLKK